MFESDDFDQVLSQIEFPEDVSTVSNYKSNINSPNDSLRVNLQLQKREINLLNNTEKKDLPECYVKTMNESIINQTLENTNRDNSNGSKNINANQVVVNSMSPKHAKRKMIHSYFDHKSKRKFPGPAGLLTGGFEENKDENLCQIELQSQDTDFTQNGLRQDLFDSPLWLRLLDDLKLWNLNNIDSINSIKQQAITGTLKKRKAHTLTVFVETVDRSVTDPLIIMRDSTGNIKGTLHRDAWTTFSKYIVSEFCAFILWKPTILTTGGAFKKHYVNITLSNILAIYSSTVLADDPDAKPLPEDYSIVHEDSYTVIKTQNNLNNIEPNFSTNNRFDTDDTDLLDELDNIFSDEIF